MNALAGVGAGPVAAVPSGGAPASPASFRNVLETEPLRPGAGPVQASLPCAPPVNPVALVSPVSPAPGPAVAPGASRVEAARVLDQVNAAQRRLDSVLALAQSGKAFTPAELIALQAQVYRASQELDLAGKVVEKATAGVKQVLQTQV